MKEVFASFMTSGSIRGHMPAARVVVHLRGTACSGLPFVIYRIKNLIQREGRLLHVAPESCLADKFKKEYDYFSIDLDGKKAMMAMDLTAMTFDDNSFDAIVCNHVLEHIPDDKKAMKELYRVLKPGGWASLQVPIKGNVTQEDLSITDPKERLRLYGQEDHVRYYGHDFTDRLKNAGFKVSIIPKTTYLSLMSRRGCRWI